MKFAGFWRRLVASVIDQFLIGLLAYFIGNAALLVSLYVAPISQAKYSGFFNIATLLSYALGGFLYFSLFEGKTGETMGKRLLKLKLVRIDQPNRDGIGVVRAGFRSVFSFIVQIFAGVNYILMLLNSERRTLHDNLFKTAVVYDPKGDFPSFDPDKLPLASKKPVLFALALIISLLAAIGQIMYFSGLV